MIFTARNFLFFLCTFTVSFGYGQFKSASDILLDIKRIRSPYRILYLAAHPDDENTRLICYFTGEAVGDVAYLSLTRGDGGQNLIGSEKGAELGVIRTEELLAARRIDGAKQYFTRAVDFGYSKSAEESLEKWGRDSILKDIVYIIRKFKPHAIINRFMEGGNAGHGHHRASAILSAEAFRIAGDPTAFPEMVSEPGIWKVSTLFVNSSAWWDENLPERAKNDLSISVLNVGKYNSLMGYSYNEQAALSRSQHKTQGFGSSGARGDQFEYLEYLDGSFKPGSLLNEDGLDSTDRIWLTFQPLLDSAIEKFDPLNPSSSITTLLMIKDSLDSYSPLDDRLQEKLKSLIALISDCAGLSIHLHSDRESYCRGEKMKISLSVVNRCGSAMVFNEVRLLGNYFSWNRPLEENQVFEDTFSVALPDSLPFSSPYWLRKAYGDRYDHTTACLQSPSMLKDRPLATLKFNLSGTDLTIEKDIQFSWTDRVRGGLEKQVEILPRVTLSFDRKLYFPDSLNVIRGNVAVKNNSHYKVTGRIFVFGEGEEKRDSSELLSLEPGSFQSRSFRIPVPVQTVSKMTIRCAFLTGIDRVRWQLNRIDCDHIRPITVLSKPSATVVPLQFQNVRGPIAYVPGPDNEMADFLREAGLDLRNVTIEEISKGILEKFGVLLFGVRSINVKPDWKKSEEAVKAFMKAGGNVVVMYQTNRDINPLPLSPYPFEISRKRITDEKANTKILQKDHPIMTYPFKLMESDFAGWNQERGLYFADTMSKEFTPLLSWHDKDELEEFGGLIVANYGKGSFIYTGISFFRHIPEGIPGSYKLFVNILSYRPKKH